MIFQYHLLPEITLTNTFGFPKRHGHQQIDIESPNNKRGEHQLFTPIFNLGFELKVKLSRWTQAR
jgi:hypothetical protein